MFETVARWKAREVEAQLRLKLSASGEGAPAILICNGEAGGLRTFQQMGRTYESVNECAFRPLGETVPLFVIGNYDSLDRPAINISYTPDHKPAAEKYGLAAQQVVPFVTEWFGTPTERAEVKSEVIELSDALAAPYESGSMLLTSLDIDSKLAQFTAVHQLTHAAFFPRVRGSTKGRRILRRRCTGSAKVDAMRHSTLWACIARRWRKRSGRLRMRTARIPALPVRS